MNNYYLGLDLGTDSIGWATTDEEYNLLRLKGKTAWGARIFLEAEDKKQRRTFRSSRRRLQRRKYRINLLDSLFAEEISKVDSTFFVRLANSTFHLEDKESKGIGKNLLFKKVEEEKLFYKKYPTIWKLRKDLVDGKEDAFSDIRNVYLALHHIIKYRGNFLHDGEYNYSSFDSSVLEKINSFLKEKFANDESSGENDFIDLSKANEFKNILLDNNQKKVNKQKSIKSLFKNDNDDVKVYIDMFASIVTGGKFKLSKIDKGYQSEIDFSNKFEENLPQIQQELGDDFELVLYAKEIYDYVSLKELLGDNKYISYVMDEIYLTHQKDLKILKKVIINIDTKHNFKGKERLYEQVFKEKTGNNYCSLVNVGSDKPRITLEDFCKFIGNILNAYKDDISKDDFDYLMSKVENRSLLKLISHASTSLIPHQLHEAELKKIIDNGSKYYPFLLTIKEKLIKLFEFRVPYYYGPLNSNSKYSNVIRLKNERVTPWNFDELFDDNKTKEKFIRSLTKKCTYLYNETVLPKASLYYEKYLILNSLNCMTCNSEKLPKELKDKVFNFIISQNKTTVASIKKYLANLTNVKLNNITIAGVKEDVPFEASSYCLLSKYFDINKDIDLIENLIFTATIYADDKASLKKILIKETNLSEEQRKAILNLPTKKWAPFSKKLLCGIAYVDDCGISHNILSILEDTNQNFQMILNNSQYDFLRIIANENEEQFGAKTTNEKIKEILDEQPTLALRSINQALLIIEDVVRASNGVMPSKIFIESTRKNDKNLKGKEKDSRYIELKYFIGGFLSNLNDEYASDANVLKEELDKVQDKLRNRQLYLYFKQMGRDVYTGEKIDIDDVLNSNKYDLDHIVPQSLIKDDSLDNMVLVNREYNQKIKGKQYPLPESIRCNPKVTKLWKYLKDKNSFSAKKYSNLTRTSELSLDELSDFVARQINVVDYSNMALKNILEIKYPETKIVFSKAQYPSFVREKYDIVKNRDLNDAHHAVDAYLNVVTGNILSTEYSDIRKIYARKMNNELATFNMERTIERELEKDDKNGEILSSKIKNNCLRHDALVTFKVDYYEGALYKQTLNKATDKSDALIPTHTKDGNPMNDTSKYGGYLSLQQSYIMAVEYEEKNKKQKCLLRVPLLYIKQSKNEEELLKKVVNKPNAKNIKLITKVQLNQKFKYGKCIYLLYTSNENCNKYKMAYQNYLNNDHLSYLKKANSILNNDYLKNKLDVCDEYVEFVRSLKDTKIIVSKNDNRNIFLELLKIINKNVYDTCNYIVSARNISLEVFDKLTLKEQLETLNNIIIMLSRNSETGKLDKRFEGIASQFNLRKSNNITNDDITLIYESPTGLFTKKVKL